MREGWVEATLKDALEPIANRPNGKDYPLVLSVTEKRGIIPQTEIFKHRIATDDISKYKVLEPMDIAYNPYLLWCGAIGQWKGLTPGIVSPVYECFRVKDSCAPRYLGLIFETGMLTDYFDALAIGSIVRRRRTIPSDFIAAPINLPPLPEQKRIVDLISSVDSYIDALEQQAESARKSRSAVLHEMLSAGGEGWVETTLGEVSEVVMGRQLSPDKKQGVRPLPYLRAANIGSWGINLEDILEMDFTKDEEMRFSSKLGDTLLVEGGNEKSVGCPAFVEQSAVGLCIQNTLIRLRSKDINHLDPKFQYHLMRYLYWQGLFAELCAGTTIMHLGQKRAVLIPVNLPPLHEQKRIVDLISSMDDEISATEKLKYEAKQLRSGLLSDLLSGEHEIPESYDEVIVAA